MRRFLLPIIFISFSISFLVLFPPPLLIGSETHIKSDALMAIQQTAGGTGNARLLSWTYGGNIYILDKDLKIINKLSVPGAPIRQILQVSNSLFVLADRKKSNGTIESVIFQYDLLGGHVQKTWRDPNYYIGSLSVNDRMPVAVSSNGDLLELDGNNLKPIAKYPVQSYYYHVKEGGPVICVPPDLSKLHWKPSFCFREGKYQWKKNGQWRSIVPPFLCGNYLIEVNVPVAKTGKADEKSISITDIATGKEVGRRLVKNLSFIGRSEARLIYASGSTLTICDVPDFNHMQKIVTNCKHIVSAVKIANTAYFINEERNLYMRKLK